MLLSIAAACTSSLPAQTDYFPKGTFSKNARWDRVEREWFGSSLKEVQEPSLLASDSPLQSYRFLWLRSFFGPIVVRLDVHKDGDGNLITKTYDLVPNSNQLKTSVNKTQPLTQEQVQACLGKINQVRLWQLPSADLKGPGCDGAEWIIEAKDGKRYHAVQRWSPQSGPVRELGLEFVLHLAQLNLPQKEIF